MSIHVLYKGAAREKNMVVRIFSFFCFVLFKMNVNGHSSQVNKLGLTIKYMHRLVNEIIFKTRHFAIMHCIRKGLKKKTQLPASLLSFPPSFCMIFKWLQVIMIQVFFLLVFFYNTALRPLPGWRSFSFYWILIQHAGTAKRNNHTGWGN